MVKGRRPSHLIGSVSGVSADELTRRALSDGLFGTTFLGEATFGITRPANPLAPLRGLSLDDSVLRPVARLLLTGHLIGEQSVQRVDSFALGPARQGARRLRARWTPRAAYSNEPDPAAVSIDGVVPDL